MKYRRDIDGLRAVAVVPVIFFHAGDNFFSSGFFGVDVFFVISGFLITKILLVECSTEKFSLVRFYERRARRILPALMFVLLVTSIFAYIWMLPHEFVEYGKSLLATSIFSSNIYFWREVGYFQFQSDWNALLHTWSLSVEEQYYIFFPVFLAIIYRFGKRVLLFSLLLISLFSLFLSQWAATSYEWANFYLLPTRAWELLIGSLCAQLLSVHAYRNVLIKFKFLEFLGLALIIYSLIGFNSETPTPSFYALMPTLGAACVILFCRENTVCYKLLSNRPMVGIGLISYSLYLWHQPVFALAKIRSTAPLDDKFLYLLIPFVFALAMVSWKYIETPFRNRSLFSARAIFNHSWIGLGSFFVFSIVIIKTSGIPTRLPGEVVEYSNYLQSIKNQRNEYISKNLCFTSNTDPLVEARSYIDTWQCKESENPDLKKVFVVGDSIAATAVMSLRLNHIEVDHLTSGGCPITPLLMNETCRLQFDYIVSHIAAEGNYDEVWLLNRFSKSALEVRNIEAMIEFFDRTNTQLVYFSSPPQFYDFQYLPKNLLHDRENFYSFRTPAYTDLQLHSTRVELIETLERNDVKFVDGAELFCALSDDCGYLGADGETLVVDRDHLSIRGAKAYGPKLIDLMR